MLGNASDGDLMTRNLMYQEDAAHQNELTTARKIVDQYKQLLDAENARNIKIEERNKLQADSVKNAARLATLDSEIAEAQKTMDTAVANAQVITDAKKTALDRISGGGGGARADLTANQRIGAYAMPGQLSMMDIAKKQLTTTEKLLVATNRVGDAIAGNNVNASFPGN